MENKRLDDVLSCCPNYDEIINYNISENDEVSRELINYYEDFVFLNFENKDKIKELDLILYEYIQSREFYNYIQEIFKEEGVVLPLFDEIKKLYDECQKEISKKVEFSVWI